MNQIEAYCAEQGYRFIDELRVLDIDRFYGSWKDGKKEKRKSSSASIASSACLKRKWLAQDIAEDLQAPPNASELNPRIRSTMKNYNAFMRLCAKI